MSAPLSYPQSGRFVVCPVSELLQTLPEIQQRIVWADALNPGGKLPAAALAREFKVTPGAIRVYRKRALDRLRRKLKERQTATTRS